MKTSAVIVLLVAWIIQNVYMVTYIKQKEEIEWLEGLRATEQGYMLYLQFEFMKESKKQMPSIDILRNAGKNYLGCMGHLIEAGEELYEIFNTRENTNTVLTKLEKLDEVVRVANEKILRANTNPQMYTSRAELVEYDPELIKGELHEIYDIMYTAFKGYEISATQRVGSAEIKTDKIENRFRLMYWSFVLLYILGALMLIADSIRATRQSRDKDMNPKVEVATEVVDSAGDSVEK